MKRNKFIRFFHLVNLYMKNEMGVKHMYQCKGKNTSYEN